MDVDATRSKPPINSSNSLQPPSEPQSKPKNWFVRAVETWCEYQLNGYAMERDPHGFCQRDWTRLNGTPSDEATEVFMSDCMKKAYDHKCAAQFSRKD